MSENGPLSGIKVLDLSKVLAGPLCSQQLSDFGAEIIKVEPIGAGDETRRWPPYKVDTGAVFLSVNRNKQSIAVDLKSAEGRQIVYQLAARADVVIESFAPGVAHKLGVDYDSLLAHRADLIYCSISGYGQTGPLSQLPGYDLILQAFSGLLNITGEEGGGPVRSPMSPIDQATGMNALAGILAALVARGRTGKGACIDVSLFDSSIALLAYTLQNYWESGRLPGKSGSGHPSLCPYQVFQASDKTILIGVPNDNLWRRFCKAAGVPDAGEDPRFATNAARVRNMALTIDFVQALVAGRTCDHWIAALIEAGVPCAPLNTLDELLNHPQTQARGMVLDYIHPALGAARGVAQPIAIDGRRPTLRSAPPVLGEHTEAILASLGYSPQAIRALTDSGRVHSVSG